MALFLLYVTGSCHPSWILWLMLWWIGEHNCRYRTECCCLTTYCTSNAVPDELQPLLFFQYLNLLFLSPHRFMVVFLSIFYSYCRIMFMTRTLSAIYQLRLALFRWCRQKSPTLSQDCLFLKQRFYMSFHETWVRKSVAIVMKK